MLQWSNRYALVWRPNKFEAANFFDIDTPVGLLTVVLCTKDEAETPELYRRIARETNKAVFHIAVAAGQGRASYPVEARVHELPMYHKGRVRDEALKNFWNACKETAWAGQAVMIHGNQSFHRGPLALAAIMVRAGYSKEEALDMIAGFRRIYAGHHVPSELWPPSEWADPHASDLLECHLWLERLHPDAADAFEPDAADAFQLDEADDADEPDDPDEADEADHADVAVEADDADEEDDALELDEPDDADALESDDADASAPADTAGLSFEIQWRCSSCDVAGQRLLQCWVCSRWDCRSCSFWCTRCPRGRRKYTICGHCNAQGNRLFRWGKIWSCPNCS